MYEKTCRCGKSKASFKIDIGPFFINECCTEAGYDEQGNLPQNELTEEEKALAAAAASAPEANDLTINDDSSLDADDSNDDQIITNDADNSETISPTASPAPEATPAENKTSNKNKNKNKNKNS